MSITSDINGKYSQKMGEANDFYNQQEQGLRDVMNNLTNQQKQLEGQKQQDQQNVDASRSNVENVASQQKELSEQMSGEGSVGNQYNKSISAAQDETGYNQQSMEQAQAQQTAASGAITAYQDSLKTAWSSGGQGNAFFQNQQQKTSQALNQNVQTAGNAVKSQFGAYLAAQQTASYNANAYFSGQRNQMDNYQNLSDTYTKLLKEDTLKYTATVNAYNDAVRAYTRASQEYSQTQNMRAIAIMQLEFAKSQELYSKITIPAMAASASAMAATSRAMAAMADTDNAAAKMQLEGAKKIANSYQYIDAVKRGWIKTS